MCSLSFVKKIFSTSNSKRLCKEGSFCGAFAEAIMVLLFMVFFLTFIIGIGGTMLTVGVCFDAPEQNHHNITYIIYCDKVRYAVKIIGLLITLTITYCIFMSCYIEVQNACDGAYDLEKGEIIEKNK